ncbi:hypothetical protein KR059_000905, partial [Drosophila kikkawai]
RRRLDKQFDYLSSQSEDSLSLSSLDSDDEFQLNSCNKEPNWSSRKRRRSTHRSSGKLITKLIYLDMEPPVATIMQEPFAELDLDDDTDLKTRIHKFLGLIPPRRKLYNLEDQDYLEPDERKAKTQDDTMTLVNAFTMETDTPDYIKAPIDLTHLPSEKWRANNCRRHKGCISCLEEYPLSYSFVDSLNPATSIKLCHPQALEYRKSDFKSCKRELAKLLFNVFNHAVFHCALQPDIVWKRSLKKPCCCEMSIDSTGQRSARLLLWENIKHPGNLIKPLLHEMCHAAAFVFNRETGHGKACRQWAYQANQQLMELPLIEVCSTRFKYLCSMCGRRSYGLMDFAGAKEMLRCYYCQFEVVVEPWSVHDGIHKVTTLMEFKTFVLGKYQQLEKQEGSSSHSSKMLCLNQQYLETKLKAACD